MSITLNPYVNFRGQAKEALEFYASVLGGEPTITTFADGGMADQVAADEQNLVMHGQIVTPSGLTLMCADAPAHIPGAGDREGYSISLSGTDSDVLADYWEGLTVGGTITVPFEVAPWGDRFGMFTDRFGVDWMINSLASGGEQPHGW